MQKDQTEVKTESTLITDLDGIKPISQILKSRSSLFIEYPHVEIQINTSTITKICKMGDCVPEETILFAFRTRATMPNYEDEDSFIQSYRHPNQTNKILDTDDIFIKTKSKDNDNDDLNNNLLTLANSGDLEKGVIDSMMHKTFFEKHINLFIVLWELSYLSLLLSGVIIFCHLCFFVFSMNVFISAYMFGGMAINCLLFFTGFLGLYYIKIEKVQKINDTWENIFLISLIILTLTTFILGQYVISQPMQDYLSQQTYFNYLYYWLLFNESACLLLNFKMNQFYVEYNFLLPLKYPLLPSRSQDLNDD